MEINDKTGTACLPTKDQTLRSGTQCWTAGWGAKLPSGHGTARYKLRETDLPMLSDEECRASGWGNNNNGKDWQWYWGDFPVFVDLDNQVCAGHKNENGFYDANHGTSVGDEGKNNETIQVSNKLLRSSAYLRGRQPTGSLWHCCGSHVECSSLS